MAPLMAAIAEGLEIVSGLGRCLGDGGNWTLQLGITGEDSF